MKKEESFPLISVCIPAYNHEKYVQECLSAVIDQSYPNLELILIDDGSTDSTWSKVQEMLPLCKQRFRRVLFLTQENQGTCVTFKRLFDLAEGECIALSASDDKFLPDALFKLYQCLKNNDRVGLAVGKNLIIDSSSVLCYWDKYRNNVYQESDACYKSFTDFIEKDTGLTIDSSQYGTYKSLLRGNHIANGWLFRKCYLNKILPFAKEAPLEDWWFMLQMSKVCSIKAIPDETFCYRWHGKNTITQIEKISRYARLTLQYEISLLLKTKDDVHLADLQKVKCYRKTRYLFGNWVKLVVSKDLYRKQKVLIVLDHNFLISEKQF